LKRLKVFPDVSKLGERRKLRAGEKERKVSGNRCYGDCPDVVIGHSGCSGKGRKGRAGDRRECPQRGCPVTLRDNSPFGIFPDVTKGILTGCTVAGSIEMADNRGGGGASGM